MHIAELTALARQMQASDIHISEGLPLAFRIHGRLEPAPVQPSAAETRASVSANGINLIDKDNRRGIFLCLFKQVADTRCTDTDIQLDEI